MEKRHKNQTKDEKQKKFLAIINKRMSYIKLLIDLFTISQISRDVMMVILVIIVIPCMWGNFCRIGRK